MQRNESYESNKVFVFSCFCFRSSSIIIYLDSSSISNGVGEGEDGDLSKPCQHCSSQKVHNKLWKLCGRFITEKDSNNEVIIRNC